MPAQQQTDGPLSTQVQRRRPEQSDVKAGRPDSPRLRTPGLAPGGDDCTTRIFGALAATDLPVVDEKEEEPGWRCPVVMAGEGAEASSQRRARVSPAMAGPARADSRRESYASSGRSSRSRSVPGHDASGKGLLRGDKPKLMVGGSFTFPSPKAKNAAEAFEQEWRASDPKRAMQLKRRDSTRLAREMYRAAVSEASDEDVLVRVCQPAADPYILWARDTLARRLGLEACSLAVLRLVQRRRTFVLGAVLLGLGVAGSFVCVLDGVPLCTDAWHAMFLALSLLSPLLTATVCLSFNRRLVYEILSRFEFWFLLANLAAVQGMMSVLVRADRLPHLVSLSVPLVAVLFLDAFPTALRSWAIVMLACYVGLLALFAASLYFEMLERPDVAFSLAGVEFSARMRCYNSLTTLLLFGAKNLTAAVRRPNAFVLIQTNIETNQIPLPAARMLKSLAHAKRPNMMALRGGSSRRSTLSGSTKRRRSLSTGTIGEDKPQDVILE